MRRKTAVYTLATQSHFHFAITLAESIVEQEWPVDMYVFVVDGDSGCPDLCSDMFKTLSLDDLFAVRPAIRLFRYTAFEMVVSLKPMAMEYLLLQGYEKVIYLDADVLVLGSIDPIASRLDRADIMFTPHVTDSAGDTCHPDDLDFVKSGTLNAGFFAARSGDSAATVLEWWRSKLDTQCLFALDESLFYDQKWCDLMPSLFPQAYIDRNPGLNVAYWNLAHRQLTKNGRSYFAGSAPVTFFHFSGIVPEDPSILSRYDGRSVLEGSPATTSALVEDYIERLTRNGLTEYRHRQYRYDLFSDRVTVIPPIARRMYRRYEVIQEAFADDPFDVSRDPGFRSTYNKEMWPGWPTLTWLAYEIYTASDEMRARFPHVPGLDTCNYVKWLTSGTAHQYRLPKAFLEPLLSSLEDRRSNVWEPILRRIRDALVNARSDGNNLAPVHPDQQTKDALINDRSGIDKFTPAHPDRQTSESSAAAGASRTLGLHKWMLNTFYRVAPKLKRVSGVKWAGRVVLDFVQSRQMAVLKRLDSRRRGETSFSPALNVVGLLKAQTGLGESSRSTIRCATAAGLHVAPVNLHFHCQGYLEEIVPAHVAPEPCQPRPVNIINVNGNLFHAAMLELGESFFLGRYNVAFWVWEMQYFPPAWQQWLPLLGEIWTPSSFSQDALSRDADVPVVRIPHGVAPEVPSHIGRSDLGLPKDGFIFLYSMDFHSISERKNPEAVVQAFTRAFGRDTPNVYLCLKLNSPEHRPDVMKGIYESIQGYDRIIVMDRHLDRLSMNALINVCDSYISLHRSEGFGLPLAEAMALGKPVIATGWSGNMDFMNVGNSFPVRFRLVELEKNVGPFEKGYSWAEPDVSHAAQLMRDVALNRDLAEHTGGIARDHMSREFSPERVGQLIRRRICRLPVM